MKVVVSYKFSGLPVQEVKKNLQLIKDSFDYLEIQSYLLTIDEPDHSKDPKELDQTMKRKIGEADVCMAFINNEKFSEGMLLELGMAYTMGKTIVVFVQKQFEEKFFLTYGIANDIVDFEDMQDFQNKFIEYFGLMLSRKSIDEIDQQLLNLIKRRLDVVKIVGKYKKYFKKDVLDNARREQVLSNKILKAKELGLNEELIRKIWDNIHDEALNIEKNI